ncbi:hypothetical protein E2C01_095414 [Portunus trituberculatus]|uniref:Uncharacterized protein n=1 Tax=Portunus trituberculatus TaxID=210409 RepID=A0A5B7K3R8_PORTR|nr:hypothetical protein [Portunus trituberculatus]
MCVLVADVEEGITDDFRRWEIGGHKFCEI